MNLIRRLFFNLWYFFNPPWDTGHSPPELISFIKNHPPGHALDLGCGTGTNAITLAKHGWRVTAIDFAAHAIYKARRKAKQANVEVEFHTGDVTHLDHLKGPFQLVLDIGCFHNLPANKRTAYTLNLKRLLDPGGYFLLYAHFKSPDHPMRGLDEEDLTAFNKNFNLVDRQDGLDKGNSPSTWLMHTPRQLL